MPKINAMNHGPKNTEAKALTHTEIVAAFPNFNHEITRWVEAGDWVSFEGTFTGDHTGPLAMADGSVPPATLFAFICRAQSRGWRSGNEKVSENVDF